MIQLDQVTKQFEGKREVTALAAVNLTIARGELVSIVGPSGSGKSTLLNLIGALDRASAGDVRIDGDSLANSSDDSLTRVRRDRAHGLLRLVQLGDRLAHLRLVTLIAPPAKRFSS